MVFQYDDNERTLFVGVNGCSLKTVENLETVRAIPMGHLMLETGAQTATASFDFVN